MHGVFVELVDFFGSETSSDECWDGDGVFSPLPRAAPIY